MEYKEEKHNFTDERVRIDRTSGDVTAVTRAFLEKLIAGRLATQTRTLV